MIGTDEETIGTHEETLRDHVHPHGSQDNHRFIRDDLEEFPLRTHVAVGRVRGVRPEHEEDMGEGKCKYDEQHIPSREEEGPCYHHEDKVTQDIEVLGYRDHRVLFFEELPHIIERLEDRRSDPALHPRSHLPVNPGNQPAKERCNEDIHECIEDRNELFGDHRITPRSMIPAKRSSPQHNDAPIMKSRSSPKVFSR